MAGRLEAGQEAGQEVRLPAVPLGVFSAAGGTSSRRCASSPSRYCPRPPPRCIALGRSSEPTISPTCNTNSVISRSRTDLAEHAADYMPLRDIVARELAAAAGGGLASTDVYVRRPAECAHQSAMRGTGLVRPRPGRVESIRRRAADR